MKDHLTYHTRFTSAELEAQYNARSNRPDYEKTVVPKWVANSEAARKKCDCTLDVRYGDGEKQKLDVFSCGDTSAPTLVYFHGGYWQRGDKSAYSFLAPPFVASGVNVVVVGYDLCPSVTLTRISQEAREAMVFLWRSADQLGLNRDRTTLMGHSAGGHITEMMMGTQWTDFGHDLPADLIKAGMPISPLSYLEPIRLTESLNSGIQMSPEEAEAESPFLNHPPLTNAPQLVVVGGAESDEFHRQARMYVEAYGTQEREIGFYIVPDVDHFDELNLLVDPSSTFFKKTCDMLQGKGPNS